MAKKRYGILKSVTIESRVLSDPEKALRSPKKRYYRVLSDFCLLASQEISMNVFKRVKSLRKSEKRYGLQKSVTIESRVLSDIEKALRLGSKRYGGGLKIRDFSVT